VVGFGGYVSLPVILAAKSLGIPVVIHEQTLEAGFTNRILARFANKICISFEGSAKYFPKDKTILTGNPIRASIPHPVKKIDLPNDLPLIYITGGSLGSHFINHLVSQTLPKLLDKYTLVHQVGSSFEFKDFDKLSILRQGLNNSKRERYIVSKFFTPDEVGFLMRKANLIVTRCGINTISELIVLEKPAYLIPLPVSSKNEQVKNAMFFKKLGLGEVADQRSLTPGIFLQEITEMMGKISSYKIRSDSSHFPKNAAKKIVEAMYATSKSHH